MNQQAQLQAAEYIIPHEQPHIFTARDGTQYTMRRKRCGSLVTATQYRDHHRNLHSAFTGVLTGRAGYGDQYALEVVR